MITPIVPPDLLQRIQDAQNVQQTLQAAASAQTRALPSDIFNLMPGSTFSATITQADAKGVLTLSTDAGSFQLRLSVPQNLPVGSTLTLQLSQIGDQSAQFRLVSLDGQPFVQTQTPNAVVAASNPQGGNQVQAEAAAQQVRAPVTQLAGIPTTVLAPADPTQVQQSTLAESWQPGTQLAVRIVAVSPPGPSQALAAQTAIQANPLPIVGVTGGPTDITQAVATQTAGAVAAPTTGAQSQGMQDATQQFGMNMQSRQQAPQTPQAQPQAAPAPWMSTSRDTWAPYSPTLFALPENPSISSAAPTVPQLLSGTVAPNTSNGHPIVITPAGLLAVETQPMPAGTRLTLEVVGQPVPPQNVRADMQAAATPYAGSAWPAMEEAIDMIKVTDPTGAQQLMASLPSISPRMAANMVAYMGAVRQGDLKGLVGERTIESIERKGGRELVKRLESEFKELGEVSSRPRTTASGTWTTYAIPMMNGQHIEPIQLNVRQAPEEADKDGASGGRSGKGGGTRFVVDLDLSRLGPMQIDGLMRGPEKKIDFILRTPKALPSEMRFDLNRIVDSMAQASGLVGSIVFQANSRFVETPKVDFFLSKRKPGVVA
jgi:hypothetical protein